MLKTDALAWLGYPKESDVPEMARLIAELHTKVSAARNLWGTDRGFTIITEALEQCERFTYRPNSMTTGEDHG